MPLPVVQPKQKIRKSRSTRWRAAVLILVHLVIAAHITHWLVTGRTLTPVEPSEAAALARSGVINVGLIFFAATILLTAVFGRFFCGWACHLVALQDLSRSLLEKIGRRPKPLRSRLLRWVPAIAFVYAFLWPAIHRWWRGDALAHVETEFTTAAFWATFPGWVVGGLTFLVCGYAVIYFLGAKGFCTYACPYGAIFGAAERLAPMRIRVTDACEGCGHCTATCTSNVRVHEEVRDWGMVVDSGCMKCLDCVSVCPNDALYYGAGPLPFLAEKRASGRRMRRFPLDWREELVLAVSFLAAFLTFRGLYGYVPFLMALGVAGLLAYPSLLTYQLATRRHVAFKGWRLKRDHAIERPGLAFLAAMAVVLVFWAHSGAVRYAIARGDRATGVVARWHGAVYDLAQPRPRLSAADRRRATEGLRGYARAQRLGLVETLGAASRMATLEYLLGDDAAARRWARHAVDREELPGRMHQLLGRIALEGGRGPLAVEHYESAIAADPADSRARTSLGIALARLGRLEEARRAFDGAAEIDGPTAAASYNLGLVDAYQGRLESAAARFAEALRLEPSHLAARENLAGTLAALGRWEESAEHYARAIRQSPEDAVTRALLARVLLELGREREAVAQLDAALEIAPDLEEARTLREAVRAGSTAPR